MKTTATKRTRNTLLALLLAACLLFSCGFTALADEPTTGAGTLSLDLSGMLFNINGTVSTSIYLPGEETPFAWVVSADTEYFTGDIYLLTDGAGLVLYSEELLGTAYGINLASFEEDFAASIFNPDSGTAYALQPEVYENILQQLNNTSMGVSLGSDAADTEELVEQFTPVIESFSEKVLPVLLENLQQSTAREKLDINGNNVQALAITYSLEGEGLYNTLKALVDWLNEDEALKEAIEELADKANIENDESGASPIESFNSYAAGLADSINNNAESFQTAAATAKLCLDSTSGAFVKGEFVLSDSATNDSTGLSVTAGTTDEGSMDYLAIELIGGETAGLYYSVVENSADLLVSDIELVSGESTYTLSFQLIKSTGEFSITLDIPDVTNYALTGTYKNDENGLVIAIDKLVVAGILPVSFGLTFSTDPAATALVMPASEEFLFFNEEQMNDALNLAMYNIQNSGIIDLLEALGIQLT